jgi:DHA1 family multidrug resistance protein-like MFS transporter
MPYWKRNLIILCISQLLTMTAFSAYLPFIPYYLQTLGVKNTAEATSWQALFDSGSAVMMMLFAPIWGTLSDRYGRKMMLVRATAAGSVLAFMMSLVQTPPQLIAIRLIQGALCGTVAAANTLVATETPDEELGRSMGVMQTAQYVGHALGPLLGGFGADTLGYRAVFPIAGVVIGISFFIITFLVREQPRRAAALPAAATAKRRAPARRKAWAALATGNTMVLVLALGSTSFAMAVVSPIMSLYVKSLSPNNLRIATLAGSIVSISAITSSLSALGMGRLGDKFGQRLVLIVCAMGVALVHVPQALATSAEQLLLWRAIQGVFMAGMMPTANALLAQSTPAERRGTVFGIASSAQAGGRSVGPVVGAASANAWGLSSAYWVTASVFSVIAMMVAVLVRNKKSNLVAEAIEPPPPVPGCSS